MKLAIIGSRSFTDFSLAEYYFLRYYNQYQKDLEIVSGGAIGADSLAKRLAEKYKLRLTEHLPDYAKYSNLAPLIRNQLIVNDAEEIICFWDGESRGSKDSLVKAKKQLKPTFIVYFKPPEDILD